MEPSHLWVAISKAQGCDLEFGALCETRWQPCSCA